MRFWVVFKTFVTTPPLPPINFCLPVFFVTFYCFQGHWLYYFSKVKASSQRVPEHLMQKPSWQIYQGIVDNWSSAVSQRKDNESDLASHLLARDHTEFEWGMFADWRTRALHFLWLLQADSALSSREFFLHINSQSTQPVPRLLCI